MQIVDVYLRVVACEVIVVENHESKKTLTDNVYLRVVGALLKNLHTVVRVHCVTRLTGS